MKPEERNFLFGCLVLSLVIKPTVPASEIDLLQAISIPFDDPKHVYFAEGQHGFPAFGLRAGSDLRTPHSLLLPVKMFDNFAILTSFKPADQQGGFLFSVVTPSNTLISLGLSITAGPSLGMQEVALYLTPLNKLRSQPLVVFTIPALSTTWNRLAVMVKGSSVKLFVNCHHTETLPISRPHGLDFDPASSLYIGQGGSSFKKPWEGVLQELKIAENANKAGRYCQEDQNSIRYEEDLDQPQVVSLVDSYNVVAPGPGGGRPVKGDRGPMGPRGPPGKSIRGPPGPPGLPGAPGPTAVVSGRAGGMTEAQVVIGECGCNETMVEEVIVSLASVLPKGDKGEVGLPGKPGLTGPGGPRGAGGVVGPPGEKGERGGRGEQGERGREGIQGDKGEAGRDGVPGVDGRAGMPGPPGPPGFMNGYDPAWQPRSRMFEESVLGGRRPSVSKESSMMQQHGLPGPKGEKGEAGLPGDHGRKGEGGAKGERGAEGKVGERGILGEPGPVGPRGQKGDTGPAGSPGLPGLSGEPGRQGVRGERGEQGQPGTLNLSGGSPEVLEVIRRIRNYNMEKGDRGLPGLRGKPGTTGIPGPPGVKGEPGPPPKLKLGSLKGQKGGRGVRGRRGRTGIPGPPGPPGPPHVPDYFDTSFSIPDTEDNVRKINMMNSARSEENSNQGPGLQLSDQALSLCSPPLTVSTSSHLQSLYGHCPPGTVVFLQPEQTLVFKVDVGWRYIVAGGLVNKTKGSHSRHVKEEDGYVRESHSSHSNRWK